MRLLMSFGIRDSESQSLLWYSYLLAGGKGFIQDIQGIRIDQLIQFLVQLGCQAQQLTEPLSDCLKKLDIQQIRFKQFKFLSKYCFQAVCPDRIFQFEVCSRCRLKIIASIPQTFIEVGECQDLSEIIEKNNIVYKVSKLYEQLSQHSPQGLTFSTCLDLLITAKIFPKHFLKRRIRQLYYYCCQSESGLTSDRLLLFFLIIAAELRLQNETTFQSIQNYICKKNGLLNLDLLRFKYQ